MGIKEIEKMLKDDSISDEIRKDLEKRVNILKENKTIKK